MKKSQDRKKKISSNMKRMNRDILKGQARMDFGK